MSTRCNILVKYYERSNGFHQYYHHCDGYPEYMGCLLDSFLSSVKFIDKSPEFCDEIFKLLLSSEGHFEDEGYYGNLHGDIEYVWYVDLVGGQLTYSERDYGESLDKFKNATQGDKEFKLKIVE